MDTPIVKFIYSTHYEGPDRRDKPRYSVLAAAELQVGNKKELVKILDVGYGGCKMHCASHLNHHSIITIAFYVSDGKGKMYMKRPITGRVISVHRSTGHNTVWVDFKGMLIQEQGLEEVIATGKLKE